MQFPRERGIGPSLTLGFRLKTESASSRDCRWVACSCSANLLGFAKRLFRTSQAITFAALMSSDQFELFEVSLFAFML